MKASHHFLPSLIRNTMFKAIRYFLPDTFFILFVTAVLLLITARSRASLDVKHWNGNCIPEEHAAPP
jgi:hypothetical protein